MHLTEILNFERVLEGLSFLDTIRPSLPATIGISLGHSPFYFSEE
jgi:hypothetical protein